MPERLTELYNPGDQVEILLKVAGAGGWYAGEVLACEHPGLWVRAAGGTWFVTNRKRIRLLEQ
ncbi:MAG: hypothetical protein U9R25_12445 [Chloroflexota bacterium]|nr:hypothetical protein [Chloroflexota bacterium]